MSGKRPKNLVASVRRRLTDLARTKGEDFQFVLTQYGLERLIYRVSRSTHADTFVLKGALLFQLWAGQPHRPTRDLDLLGYGAASPDRFERIFQEICTTDVEEDGLEFLADRVRAEPIKEEDEYQGLRVRVEARLGNARISLQIDIGFGDVVCPEPIAITYPTLLDFPAPSIQAYPRESVIAEKVQAMVMLGMANSRMKDFYDLWTLARQFRFDGAVLCSAIRATFERRKTALPSEMPLALTSDFSADRDKGMQWNAFIRKGIQDTPGVSLVQVVDDLRAFLIPLLDALAAKRPFDMHWPPSGPWMPLAPG